MTSGRPHTPAEIPEYILDDELPRTQNEPRRPLSPKALAPLVIPTSTAAARQLSLSRLRSATPPVEAPIRSARREDSPRAGTPFTPLSASLTTPRSAATTAMTASTLPTPISAATEHRASPRPWEKAATSATTAEAAAAELSSTPKTEISDPIQRVALGHRRHQSESASIMERGRPRKRSETCGPTIKRTGSKRSKSTEKRAFEQLPKGWKASDAVNVLSPTEVASLQQQALQQAARFEVLRKEDVDSLSRVRIHGAALGLYDGLLTLPQELRQLDERTEFLRHTYTTLRAGRRNLHTRICQYLRSPRTAKFSAESMLKQEEAVAELDTSIDEWVIKLEQAENRRTRVRQKLLEHVAAAATLAVPNGGVIGVSESLQHAIGVRPPNATTDLSTPPRSPVKPVFTQPHSSSPSPHRAHVPSTILEQPLFEEAAALDDKEAEAGAALRRAETIRVYADNGVFDLLADVEDAIKRMGGGDVPPVQERSETPLSDAERTKLCRARSHEALSGGSPARKPLPISKLAEKPSSSSLSSVVAANTPAADPAPAPEALFLTNAVFKPER